MSARARRTFRPAARRLPSHVRPTRPRSLYGQSSSRLLVGARISVRLATTALNAIVNGRVVRSSLTEVRNGVPRYEVALTLEEAVDWSRDTASAEPPALDAVPVPVSVPVRARAE